MRLSRCLTTVVCTLGLLAMGGAVSAQEAITVTPGMAPVSVTSTVTADQPAGAFGANCLGSLPEEATQTVTVTATAFTSFVVHSDSDTVLALRSDSVTYCNDDADGSLNPRISATLEPGEYELFVGTYLPGVPAEYTVNAVAGERPTINTGTAGDTQLTSGFAETTMTGISGGTMPANIFGIECLGNLPQNPQHVITVGTDVAAVFDVESVGDTTMVIVSPSAVYCNDDTNGFNPQIVVNLSQGTHYVYVGNYFGTTPTEYTLRIRP